MKKSIIYFALGALCFGLSVRVEAQQPAGKVPRIGFLIYSSPSIPVTGLRLDAFRQGLRELGYVDGKNLVIDYRYAEGKSERLKKLAEELVRLKVDILVVDSITTARAASNAAASIPIVFASGGDPIGSGLVASFARPGGTVTGLYQYSPELLGKRLELLKEVVPKVSRIAFLNSADGTAAGAVFKDEEKVLAKKLAVQLRLVEVKDPNPNIEGAFQGMVKEKVGALVTSSGPLLGFQRNRIFELTEHYRIPAMYPEQEWANAGGLMSYGANIGDLYRRCAVYVDKILKGAKPSDLPVEQPTKFEFVINLKTAKAINVTIPQSVLYRADRVIR